VQPRSAARRAVHGQRAVERGDPIGESAQARARGSVGAADAVVGDVDGDQPVYAPHRDRGLGRLGVLRDVRERLGDHEVGGDLDRAR
jgi:hypothetical protein